LLVGNVAECRGTLSWMAIVTATRLVLRGADPRLQRRLLQSASTNLSHLAHDPINVLLTSICFVTSTKGYLTFLLGAVLISAPVERWLGLRRWLATVALGHVGATLVIALGLKIGVSAGWIDPAVRRALDVGISYAMRGLAGALYFAVGHRRLRRAHLVLVLAFTVVPLVASHTFTDAGHVVALSLGLLTGALFHRKRAPLHLADLERPVLLYTGGRPSTVAPVGSGERAARLSGGQPRLNGAAASPPGSWWRPAQAPAPAPEGREQEQLRVPPNRPGSDAARPP
jgi:hypothetical protein